MRQTTCRFMVVAFQPAKRGWVVITTTSVLEEAVSAYQRTQVFDNENNYSEVRLVETNTLCLKG